MNPKDHKGGTKYTKFLFTLFSQSRKAAKAQRMVHELHEFSRIIQPQNFTEYRLTTENTKDN